MSIVPGWVELDTLTGDVICLAHVACAGISGSESPQLIGGPARSYNHVQRMCSYISIDPSLWVSCGPRLDILASLQEHSTTLEETTPLGSTEDFTSLSKTCFRDKPRRARLLFHDGHQGC